MPSPAVPLVALSIAVSLLSGCALFFTERLERGHPREATPRCSGNRGPVVADAVISGVSALSVAIVLVAGRKNEDDELVPVKVVAGGYGTLGLVHVVSAFLGHHWAKECQESRADHDRWLMEASRSPMVPGAPPALTTPVMPPPLPPPAVGADR
jgi:hypothetical protein